MKSATIFLVGHHSRATSFMLTRSVMKKLWILICLMCLPLDAFPFLYNSIELLLSCKIRFSTTPYPCSRRKFRVQIKIGIISSTPTNSLSVELFVLSFCLVEVLKKEIHVLLSYNHQCVHACLDEQRMKHRHATLILLHYHHSGSKVVHNLLLDTP